MLAGLLPVSCRNATRVKAINVSAGETDCSGLVSMQEPGKTEGQGGFSAWKLFPDYKKVGKKAIRNTWSVERQKSSLAYYPLFTSLR